MSCDVEQAIVVENVTKAYRIWPDPAARLKSPLFDAGSRLFPKESALRKKLGAAANAYYRDFFALRDVSFSVRKGESIGIIGRNGSGKSTLLQIIAGTLQPTSGTVNANGKVAALLELGSGFNPEFTGRENVFLNAAVLGLTKPQTEARFDKIAAFADIGEFLDQPVKTYSSGMSVRLAFAVCAHVDAEILIVDEALSVGDSRFQLKCARTIDRFIDEGRTLLFVSHDVSAVNRLCTAAILLEHGQVQLIHSPRIITHLYAKMMADDHGLTVIATDLERARENPFDRSQGRGPPATDTVGMLQSEVNCIAGRIAETPLAQLDTLRCQLEEKQRSLDEANRAMALTYSESMDPDSPVANQELSVGGETARIESLEVVSAKGQSQRAFHTGEVMEIRALIRAFRDIPSPVFACRVRNTKGMDIYATNTFFLQTPTPSLSNGQTAEVSYRLILNVLGGSYFVSCSCVHFEGTEVVVHHRRYDAIEILVIQDNQTFGIANCHATITVRAAQN